MKLTEQFWTLGRIKESTATEVNSWDWSKQEKSTSIVRSHVTDECKALSSDDLTVLWHTETQDSVYGR